MKLIGIDYGTRRVGVAVSDDVGRLAFPKMTLPNNAMLLGELAAFIRKEKAEAIVLGESKDLAGADNPVMAPARRFAEALEQEVGLLVHFEPEWYTSKEARRLKDGARAVDAEAAAIILTSYLDKQNTYDDID